MRKHVLVCVCLLLISGSAMADGINVMGIYFNKLIGAPPTLSSAIKDLDNTSGAKTAYIILANPDSSGVFKPGPVDGTSPFRGVKTMEFNVTMTVTGSSLASNVRLYGINTAALDSLVAPVAPGTYTLKGYRFYLDEKVRHPTTAYSQHIGIGFITLTVPNTTTSVSFKLGPNPSSGVNNTAPYVQHKDGPVYLCGNSSGGTPGGANYDAVVATINVAGNTVPNEDKTWSDVKSLYR